MTARDFRRDGYLLGGFSPNAPAPSERRFVQANDAHMPYTDRKLMRSEDAPLDLDTLVKIQQMACAGYRRDEIYKAFMDKGVTLEQIWRALDPPDEGTKLRRHSERANVGYAGFKRKIV